MADARTVVEIPGSSGFAEWGYVTYSEAVEVARKYYEHTLGEAQAALAALDRGDVKVFHQRGITRARNRLEVARPETVDA
jgi:hypothetical protein